MDVIVVVESLPVDVEVVVMVVSSPVDVIVVVESSPVDVDVVTDSLPDEVDVIVVSDSDEVVEARSEEVEVDEVAGSTGVVVSYNDVLSWVTGSLPALGVVKSDVSDS